MKVLPNQKQPDFQAQLTQFLAQFSPSQLEQIARRSDGYPDIRAESRTHVPTDIAAHWLGRRNQTLRGWACLENGPLRPIRVSGKLAWPVSDIRRLLGVA